MAKLSLGVANLKLKWSMRLPPDKWKSRIKRGSAACSDIALTSLTALLESADAFPPLKSAVGGVLALWNTVEVGRQRILVVIFATNLMRPFSV
jgi:hypothetical protein